MKVIFSIASLLLMSVSSYASLSPYWQSAAEIKAIAESPEVQARLSKQYAIDSIQRTAPGEYVITSSNCGLGVHIKYIPVTHPGPARFSLEPGQMVCQ